MEIAGKNIYFPDFKINILNGKLEKTEQSKTTNSHLYLHAKSCHKPSSVSGIEKGVAFVSDLYVVPMSSTNRNQSNTNVTFN